MCIRDSPYIWVCMGTRELFPCHISATIVDPGYILFKITQFSEFASRLSTTFRNNFFILLQMLPSTHRVLVIRPLLYFLQANALSSISVSPGPPIFKLLSINQTIRISLNSFINFCVVFLFINFLVDKD